MATSRKKIRKVDASVEATSDSPGTIQNLDAAELKPSVNGGKPVTKKEIRSFSMKEKLKILRELDNGSVQSVCAKYDLHHALIRKWKKKKEFIEEACQKENTQNKKKNKAAQYSAIEQQVYTWFLKMRANNVPISGAMIQTEALRLNEELGGNKDFKASNGWLNRWKSRNGIRSLTISAKELSAAKEEGDDNQSNFTNTVKSENVTEAEVFNSDQGDEGSNDDQRNFTVTVKNEHLTEDEVFNLDESPLKSGEIYSPGTIQDLDTSEFKPGANGGKSVTTLEKRSFTMKEKLKILRELENGSWQSVCEKYGLHRTVIRKWEKNKESIEEACQKENTQNKKKNKAAKYSEIEQLVYMWFLEMRANNVAISGAMIQAEALRLNEELGGNKNFKASNGWLEKWRSRKGIKSLTISSEELSPEFVKTVESENLIESSGTKQDLDASEFNLGANGDRLVQAEALNVNEDLGGNKNFINFVKSENLTEAEELNLDESPFEFVEMVCSPGTTQDLDALEFKPGANGGTFIQAETLNLNEDLGGNINIVNTVKSENLTEAEVFNLDEAPLEPVEMVYSPATIQDLDISEFKPGAIEGNFVQAEALRLDEDLGGNINFVNTVKSENLTEAEVLNLDEAPLEPVEIVYSPAAIQDLDISEFKPAAIEGNFVQAEALRLNEDLGGNINFANTVKSENLTEAKELNLDESPLKYVEALYSPGTIQNLDASELKAGANEGKPGTTKKIRSFTMKEKLKILRELDNWTVQSVCEKHNLHRSVIKKWKKNKESIEEACQKENTQNKKRNKAAKYSEIDKQVYIWFQDMRANEVPISGPMIQAEALRLNKELGGNKSFKASNGWLENWRSRKGIRSLTMSSEELSAAKEGGVNYKRKFVNTVESENLTESSGTIQAEALRFNEDLGGNKNVNSDKADKEATVEYQKKFADSVRRYNLTKAQVFNFDEFAMKYKTLPNKPLSQKGEMQAPEFNTSKDGVTVGACCNADGSLKLPLVIIGKFPSPRAFRNLNTKNLPVSYKSQKDSSMDAIMFEDWFFNEFVPRVRTFLQDKKLPNRALLIVDNCTSHTKLNIDDIEIEFLPPIVTWLIQPLDQGILETLKRHYKVQVVSSILDDQEKGSISLMTSLKSITVKEVIYWISDAWEQVTPGIIYKCWSKLWPTETQSVAVQTDDVQTLMPFLDSPIGAESEEVFIHGAKMTVENVCKQVQNIHGYSSVDPSNVFEWLTAEDYWGMSRDYDNRRRGGNGSSSSKMRMDTNTSQARPHGESSGKRKELDSVMRKARESQSSSYWNKKLLEAEERDPNRWRHSGYKELYIGGAGEPSRGNPRSPRSPRPRTPPRSPRPRSPRPRSPRSPRDRSHTRGRPARSPSSGSTCSDRSCSVCSPRERRRVVPNSRSRSRSMTPVRSRPHPKEVAPSSSSARAPPPRARPRSPPLPRPRTPPLAPQPPRHQKEYKVKEIKPRRKEKPISRVPEDPRIPDGIPMMHKRIKVEKHTGHGDSPPIVHHHARESSPSEDSDSSSNASHVGPPKMTLSERFGKMAQWSVDRRDMENMRITKDGENAMKVVIEGEERIARLGYDSPPPGHYPESLLTQGPRGLECWDDVRVRYDYYKARGYLRDLSLDDYVKWEEWWYKYQEWLEAERYYEQWASSRAGGGGGGGGRKRRGRRNNANH